MLHDIRAWLNDLGLAKHADAFEDNGVDGDLLGELTNEDLKDLGVNRLGDRKILLAAIQALPDVADEEAVATPLVEQPRAERRQLTVMFVDMVDSTALSSRLDPEELRDIITEFQNVVAGAVTRFDGQIARYMGDGVLCYFGWPKAHEDDAERSVHSALAILSALGRIGAHGQEEIAARIGIATGVVVVGDLIGEGAAEEEAVVGETPNLASRMQSLAEPGHILVSQETRNLLGGIFDVVALPRQRVKGIPDDKSPYRIAGLSETTTRFEARASGPLSDMVGRDQELHLVLDRWRQTERGEGQVLLLSGEAGIGKSRIVRAVVDALRDEVLTRVEYQCSPYHAESAFFPVVQQLTHAAAIMDGDREEEKLDKLEALLSDGGAPIFAALMGLDGERRYGPLGLTPQQQRAQTLQALTDELVTLSQSKPVLFVVEDAHWIDASTLELLDICVDRIGSARVLVLISARPEFDHSFSGHTAVTRLELNRLGKAQVAAIIANVVGDKTLPEELVEDIADRADGVPLFVEELTKAVLESGQLRETPAGYEFAGPVSRPDVPMSLSDSLMARLDRHQPAKEIAQIAACIGREFNYSLLERVAPFKPEQIQSALDELCDSELLFRRGAASEARYMFKHALVSDTAYQSLLRSRRRSVHKQLAEILSQEHGAGTPPEVLAHHYTEAGQPEEAYETWDRAGDGALSRAALREAAQHFRAALSQLSLLPESRNRDRAELSVLTRLGWTLVNIDGWASSEANVVHERARALADQLGTAAERVSALVGLWIFHLGRAEHEKSGEISEQLFDMARTLDDTELLLQAHHAAWPNLMFRAQLSGSAESIDTGLRLYDQKLHGHHAQIYMGHDPLVCGHSIGAWVKWALGRVDEAEEHARQAVAHSESIGHIPSLIHCLTLLGSWHISMHDPERALDAAERLGALAAEFHLGVAAINARTYRGWALLHLGESETGLRELESGVDAWRRTGSRVYLPHRLSLLEEAYAKAGKTQAAEDCFAESLRLMEETSEKHCQPEIWLRHAKALLLSGVAAQADAERSITTAFEVAKAQTSSMFQLQAAIALAELSAETNRPNGAREALASTLELFPEAEGLEEVRRASSLLQSIPGR